MQDEKTLFEKIYEASEDNLSRLAKELSSHPAFSEVMEKTLRNAITAKGKVDRNIAALLGILNIPSKADYDRLLTKVETIQGTLVNVNMKLDRLLALKEKEHKKEEKTRKKAPSKRTSYRQRGEQR